jgi:hypothetical protein
MMYNYPLERCKMICILEGVNAFGIFLGEYFGEFIKDEEAIQAAFLVGAASLGLHMVLCVLLFKEHPPSNRAVQRQSEEESDDNGNGFWDILSSDHKLLFLLALGLTSLNISSMRSTITTQYQLFSVDQTDENIVRMTLLIAFVLGSLPLYRLVSYAKSTTIIQVSLLLSAYSLFLFGPSQFLFYDYKVSSLLGGQVVQEIVHTILLLPILPSLIQDGKRSSFSTNTEHRPLRMTINQTNKVIGLYVFFRYSGYLLGHYSIYKLNELVGPRRSFDLLAMTTVWFSLIFFFIITFPDILEESKKKNPSCDFKPMLPKKNRYEPSLEPVLESNDEYAMEPECEALLKCKSLDDLETNKPASSDNDFGTADETSYETSSIPDV